MSSRTYILPGFVIVLYMTLVHGSIMFALHTPQPALNICGWACGPGGFDQLSCRGERERERDRTEGRREREEKGGAGGK